MPITVKEPESEHANIYRDIAAKVWSQVSGGSTRSAPKIVFE
jgi:ATP-binding protein involved in chromosome partitioning